MKLGLSVWVCTSFTPTFMCVCYSVQQHKKKTAPEKVISLVALEFGKSPRVLCRQQQCSSTKRLWGCRYLCHTPAAKVTALSQITVDLQPFMMPSVSWLSKETGIICYPSCGWVIWGGASWSDQPWQGAEKYHRETLRLGSLCCTAALWGYGACFPKSHPLLFTDRLNPAVFSSYHKMKMEASSWD